MRGQESFFYDFTYRGVWHLIHMVLKVFILNFATAMDNVIILASIFNRAPSRLWRLILCSTLVLTATRVILVHGIHLLTRVPGLQLCLAALLMVLAIRTAMVERPAERSESFGRLLFLVFITDLAVSIDNIVSIASASSNFIELVVGVFLSTLVLLLMLPVFMKVFHYVPWLQIIAGGIMAQAAVHVMVKDPLFQRHTLIFTRLNLGLIIPAGLIFIMFLRYFVQRAD